MKKGLIVVYSLLILGGCGYRPEGFTNIVIKGSDTEVNVALALAESFMLQDSAISIGVTGGGSGVGVAALINGKTDIANSSRPIKEEEVALARERGIEPVATIFAKDALAIVAHASCPVDSLTFEQIAAIFSGKIDNWADVGGVDRPISLYGRQSNSGTFVFFRDAVIQGEYSSNIKQMNGTAQIVEAIKVDEAGIGYVGVGYIVDKSGTTNPDLKVINVVNQEGLAISPTLIENIESGKYPITRPLFQYTNGKPTGKLREFMVYTLSPEGQKIVRDNGYYGIAEAEIAENKTVSGVFYGN